MLCTPSLPDIFAVLLKKRGVKSGWYRVRDGGDRVAFDAILGEA